MVKLTDFYELKPQSGSLTIFAEVSVAAGEPKEAEELFEWRDLNEFFTDGKEGVFIIRASGDSMETDIRDGDWLIVNRNLQPKSGDIIIASVNGAHTVKIYSSSQKGLRLVASNGNYTAREVTRRDDFQVFGVVTHVIHKLKKI